jgi:hypothetical protein
MWAQGQQSLNDRSMEWDARNSDSVTARANRPPARPPTSTYVPHLLLARTVARRPAPDERRRQVPSTLSSRDRFPMVGRGSCKKALPPMNGVLALTVEWCTCSGAA